MAITSARSPSSATKLDPPAAQSKIVPTRSASARSNMARYSASVREEINMR